MYSFTKHEKLPFVTVQCECGRRFIPEEMYCCLNCSQAFCRFCTTQELFCYYCRHCGDTHFPNDLIQVKTFCQTCFECANCKSVLQLLIDKNHHYFFQCQYCYWNSKTLAIQDFKSDQLYSKIQQEHKRLNELPQAEFNEKVQKLKELDQDILKRIQTMKAKKQFKTSFTPKSAESLKRYTHQEIEEMSRQKEKKYVEMKYHLDVAKGKQRQEPEFELKKELAMFDRQVFKRLDNYSKLPNQLNLLVKKNRNCRQCGKIILKLEKQKDNKFVPNLSQFLCEYTPTFVIKKVRKHEENLLVDINVINKTKTQLKVNVKQLNTAQRENHKLSDTLEFPLIQLTLPTLELDTQHIFCQQCSQQNAGEQLLVHRGREVRLHRGGHPRGGEGLLELFIGYTIVNPHIIYQLFEMVLTQKQREELHQAIFQYLANNQFPKSADIFKEESQVPDNSNLEKNLLEQKWSSIVRLSKKVMTLEMKIEELTQELQTKGTKPFSQKEGDGPAPFIPKEKYSLKGHRGAVNTIHFHPSYSMIGSGSDDGTIKLWDYEQGTFEQTLKGHTSAVNCVCFDPQGKYVASASSVTIHSHSILQDLSIKLWELKNYQCVKTFLGHEHSVSCVEFSSQGDFLISSSRDKTMRLWEIQTGFCKKTYAGHQEWVRCCTFSEDNKFIASGSQDQSIIIWQTDNTSIIQQMYGHENQIEIVRYLPKEHVSNLQKKQGNGLQQTQLNYLVSAGRDKEIKLWNVQQGHDNWVNGIAFHSDGIHMYSVSEDKTIRVWDMVQQKQVRKLADAHDRFILKVSVATGQLVMATCSLDQNIKIWHFQ